MDGLQDRSQESYGGCLPEFCREFTCKAPVRRATLTVTAMGTYEAVLNGSRISDYVLAPGWTSYETRHQYQQYDVTAMLQDSNDLRILVGRDWYRAPWLCIDPNLPAGVIAQLELEYADGSREWIVTDESWQVRGSIVRFSELYNGETADATAAVIVPWQLYLTYGDREILQRQFECMKSWGHYIGSVTKDEYLWTGHDHFGDWLGLDAPVGSYKGSTREDFIASAFYANCADLLAKTAAVLGQDNGEYVQLHEKIVAKFRETFPAYTTQTEAVLALTFGLAEDPAATAVELARRIRDCGTALQTGFVGTPYLLFALSSNGYTELAYDLLLRREYPSWLYPIRKGATTIWEHWDGIMENGDFWSPDMNSFNHYAYGCVMGWVYEEAAGIQTVEDAPGFARVRIAPRPDRRLGWLEAAVDTAHGRIFSGWYYETEGLRYEIQTPVKAHVVLGEKKYDLEPGK